MRKLPRKPVIRLSCEQLVTDAAATAVLLRLTSGAVDVQVLDNETLDITYDASTTTVRQLRINVAMMLVHYRRPRA
jgi:hypothetical protein